ncbi:MAG: DNA polymerase III subunit beta [Lachnospiraceae bacterium]|nr:DNA polymerase III subunit beta [Lachnospiraceae bacterium]
MKIKCSKANLLAGINIVLKAVPVKTTMNILECILIKAVNGQIKLVSNDMELGIETVVVGDIAEEGVIAINAKIFSDMVRKLPDSDVTIETDSSLNTKITCEKSKFSISAKDGSEFPELPVIEKSKRVTMSEFSLRSIIVQTVFSISDNENNKIMTGELFEIKGSKMRVVALDGHRIAVRNLELKEDFGNYKVIVPGKALNEISKILSGEADDEVNIYFADKNIMFELEDTIILSRLIEGEYYKIDQMLSSDFETKITVNKRELFNSIDRATLLIKESDKKPVVIETADQSLKLKMDTSIGSLDDEIMIEKEGKDIVIGFNPKFIIEALRVIDDENIDIYLVNSKSPCFIRDAQQNYIYLILPVNFVS